MLSKEPMSMSMNLHSESNEYNGHREFQAGNPTLSQYESRNTTELRRNQYLDHFLDEWASEVHKNEVNCFLSQLGLPGLPSFSGVNPEDWIDGCEEYFETHESAKVYQYSIVTNLLIGKAREWFLSWKLSDDADWNEFINALGMRFKNEEQAVFNSSEENHEVLVESVAMEHVVRSSVVEEDFYEFGKECRVGLEENSESEVFDAITKSEVRGRTWSGSDKEEVEVEDDQPCKYACEKLEKAVSNSSLGQCLIGLANSIAKLGPNKFDSSEIIVESMNGNVVQGKSHVELELGIQSVANCSTTPNVADFIVKNPLQMSKLLQAFDNVLGSLNCKGRCGADIGYGTHALKFVSLDDQVEYVMVDAELESFVWWERTIKEPAGDLHRKRVVEMVFLSWLNKVFDDQKNSVLKLATSKICQLQFWEFWPRWRSKERYGCSSMVFGDTKENKMAEFLGRSVGIEGHSSDFFNVKKTTQVDCEISDGTLPVLLVSDRDKKLILSRNDIALEICVELGVVFVQIAHLQLRTTVYHAQKCVEDCIKVGGLLNGWWKQPTFLVDGHSATAWYHVKLLLAYCLPCWVLNIVPMDACFISIYSLTECNIDVAADQWKAMARQVRYSKFGVP